MFYDMPMLFTKKTEFDYLGLRHTLQCAVLQDDNINIYKCCMCCSDEEKDKLIIIKYSVDNTIVSLFLK